MLMVGSLGAIAPACSSFVAADETGTDGGDASSSSGVSAATQSTNPSSDTASDTEMSDSASAGSTAGTISQGSTDATQGTDPSGPGPSTDTASTDASQSRGDETGPADTSSTGGETSDSEPTGASDSDPTGGAESGAESDSEPGKCIQLDEEPNGLDDPSEIQSLGEQFCDDAPSMLQGTLLDDADLDVFVYDGIWDCGNANDPNHVVTVVGGVDACLFPVCEGTGTETFCIQGSITTTDDGIVGCCSNDVIVADVNCTVTFDETALGFISVSPPAPDTCYDYTLTYAVEDA